MISAWLAGLRQVAARPLLLGGVFLVNLLVALPAAWVVASALEDSFGTSRVADDLRDGFDMGWYGEFEADARGVASTFTPTHTGIGALLDNLEDWATGGLFDGFAGLIGLGLVYAVVWALLLGGVLTRFAAPRGSVQVGFVEAGGRYFFRFMRLALLAAPLYFLVYRLHRLLQDQLAELTRDVTRESVVVTWSVLALLLVGFLLMLVRACFDYAKIATVLEERRSMLLAALRGIGFVLVHPARTLGLCLLVALGQLVALLLYALVAPGATQGTTIAVGLAFAVGQALLIARLGLRLSLLAGEMTLYRRITDERPEPAPVRAPETSVAPAGAGTA